jgi:hypothetical protein
MSLNNFRSIIRNSFEVKIGLTLFFMLGISYAYFSQPYRNWNAVSRISLSLALVEDGTVTINNFHMHTGDKAFFGNNYYSDKAPGLSFTALPFVVVSKFLLRLKNKKTRWDDKKLSWEFGFITYFCTVFTSGLFTAIAALLLYFISLRIGASVTGAIFGMLSFGLASTAWGWATAFFGHAVAGSCLFIAFAIIIRLNQAPAYKQRDMLLGFIAGAAISWAIVVEYTASIPSAIIAVFGIFHAKKWEKRRAIQVIICAIIGGLIFIIPIFIYNFMAFDSPFVIGYSNLATNEFIGMNEGLFGITFPRLKVLFTILFSPYRGMLWFSPILFMAPIGIFFLWRNHGFRDIALAITLISSYYLLLNSAYHYWDGGWSTGPRHITPMLPFLCLPLSFVWTDASLKWKRALIGLFLLSFSISFVCVSASMFSPDKYQNPLFDYLIPKFIEGKLNFSPMIKGLGGRVALIPIIGIWALCSIYVSALLFQQHRNQ